MCEEVDKGDRIDVCGVEEIRSKKGGNCFSLCSWNMRTLLELPRHNRTHCKRPVDKVPFLLDECRHYKLGVMCIQEVRWKGCGYIDRDEYRIYYSGNDVQGREGVGIVVHKRYVDCIDSVKYVSPRIMSIAGTFDGEQCAIFSVYGPTNVYSLESKNRFWEQLEDEYREVQVQYKIRLVLGDMNARIGDYEGGVWDEIRGRHVGGVQNENGLLLLEFCLRNKLLIANTIYEKSEYGTWRHFRSRRWHCLDYCLLDCGARKHLVDCGINTHMDCWTDHVALGMKLKWKHPKKKFFGVQGKKVSTDFQLLVRDSRLCNSLGVRIDDALRKSEVVSFKQLLDICSHVCAEEIPTKTVSRKHQDWFDSNRVEVLLCVVERRAARKAYLSDKSNVSLKQVYRRLCNTIQKETRRMRILFWNNVADNIQDLFDKNESRGYFAAMKHVYGFSNPKSNIKALQALDGSIVKTKEEISVRWRQHFHQLLNEPGGAAIDIQAYLPTARVIEESLGAPFVMRELLLAFDKMKRRKATGEDGLPSEFFNYVESNELMRLILKLVNVMLTDGVVENVLKDAIIAYLFKKGEVTDCNNYRGLSLLAHIGKVFERMIHCRLDEYVERLNILPESQCGFRRERSTIDMIFCSRRVTEYFREKSRLLFKCFVDLTKAYDKVDRDVLWMVLSALGIPQLLINLIKAFHEGAAAKVRVEGELSDPFDLKVGLKQGSIFSPLLFNIFFGAAILAILIRLEKLGVPIVFSMRGEIFDLARLRRLAEVDYRLIVELMFADDCAVLAESEKDMQSIMNVFDEVCVAFGQAISVKKTEIMVIAPRGVAVPAPRVTIGGVVLKVVRTFKYLGSTENDVGTMDDEIQIRVQRMVAGFSQLDARVFSNRDLGLKVKLRVFHTCVVEGGIYAAATWNCSSAHLQKLESCQFRLLRKICRLSWKDFASYEDIIQLAARVGVVILPLECRIRHARLKYLGHVERMADVRLPKILLHGELAWGLRKSGGQHLSYRQVIKDDLKKFGIVDPWGVLALDRGLWRRALYDGKKKYIADWLAKRAVEHRKRHIVDGGSEVVFSIHKHERLQERHAEVVQYMKVDEAMRAGHITLRSRQVVKSDFVKGKYRLTKTKRTLEVGVVLDLLCEHVVSQEPWVYLDKGKTCRGRAGRIV